ncbi:unnamed protein product [Phytophthora lilii]|uniref:Unnamed protein product n=1 Tax=Phytophthora lilii TaxID=2077276 RepID=A0A9W7D839_9STRA|nr:unnamed protein product [Phytophthora lilii]
MAANARHEYIASGRPSMNHANPAVNTAPCSQKFEQKYWLSSTIKDIHNKPDNSCTHHHPQPPTNLHSVLLASGFNAFSTAGWNAIDLMSAESFPTDVRTTGMGILSAAGRAGSVAAQFVNGYLIGPPVHVTWLLVVTASMMLLGSASSVFVRNYSNKTLPESVEEMRIQARATKSKA